jgi:hypothetical protein
MDQKPPSSSPDSIGLPWLLAGQPDLEVSIMDLISAVNATYENESYKILLQAKVKKKLLQEYGHAGQSRGSANKAMTAIAQAIGVPDYQNAVYVAPMKELQRAAEKYNVPDRNMHDLGRGTIYIHKSREIENFLELSESKQDMAEALKKQNVSIIPGSVDNYFSKPRSSGFHGSLNFDYEVEFTKGRSGKFEVQMVPHSYIETNKNSHYLYAIIRKLQEIPENNITKFLKY